MPRDADAETVEAIVEAVVGLVRAAERGDRLQVIGALNLLLAVLVEHGNAPLARDEALRRAVAQMSRGR